MWWPQRANSIVMARLGDPGRAICCRPRHSSSPCACWGSAWSEPGRSEGMARNCPVLGPAQVAMIVRKWTAGV